MKDADTIALFGAVYIDPKSIPQHTNEATIIDIVSLAMSAHYALTSDLVRALEKLTPRQRGTVFVRLAAALTDLVGAGLHTSPLYRTFPNHKIMPLDYRWACLLLHLVGIEVQHDPALYGADPVTGLQNDTFGQLSDYDSEFTLTMATEAGNERRKLRFLKLADSAFLQQKLVALMNNLTPFSAQENNFVLWALKQDFVDWEELASIRFREKLPLIWGAIPEALYGAVCNSVTDALRLAIYLSGPYDQYVPRGSTRVEPDLSLKTPPRFSLKKSEARSVLAILEGIIAKGNTDHETDLLRHEEFWKRFAEHVRVRQFQNRFPNAVNALLDLRLGWLKSWESRYAAAPIWEKIQMAKARPGTFVRRLTALYREAEKPEEQAELLDACRKVFPQVDVPKLLQLYTHLTRTVFHRKRFHMLPDGTILSSEAKPTHMSEIASTLGTHLMVRLKGTLQWGWSPEGMNAFIPAGNRAVSTADVRTSRGDRVLLAFDDEDTIRLFLHWHHPCDVDLSAVFYDADMNEIGRCSYYDLSGRWYTHSGDILDGRRGAAEYIDVSVDKARRRGVRYVLMNANVYSGDSFASFPCYVGAMIRDGKTGKHFEISTVETKLKLDSDTRNTSPAIFDLETGQMVYVDLHSRWEQRQNVDSKRASLKETLEYFLNYADYRPSFGMALAFAGTPDGPQATLEDIRENRDEILAKLAAA